MICDFYGSYYDPSPWTEQACFAQDEIPAGCPIDIVIAGDAVITVEDRDSSRVVVDTVTKTFTVPDEGSCDCAPTELAVELQRIALTVDAVEGDVVKLSIAGRGYDFTMGAPGPCVTAWPDDYAVALACDRCPGEPPVADPTSPAAGCNAGGGPSLLLGLLLIARRGRSRGAAAPR